VSEILCEVQEDDGDGGYVATALGHAIVTQGETLDHGMTPDQLLEKLSS
jgi:hypothetical protein